MNKKVLLVDDEPVIRDLISMALKTQDYAVRTAENGRDGLTLLESERPDLVMLDVMMPIMDGFELFKTIKSNAQNKDIPILILTARKKMQDTFEALGADAFIFKPFDPQDLVGKIRFLFAEKALVLCDNPDASNVISEALKSNGFDGCIAKNEADMFMKGKETKYKAVVIQPSLITGKPGEFLSKLSQMKYSNPKIIVYSDVYTKGTEDGSTLAIENIKTRWSDAGMKAFYDSRIVSQPFSELMKSWLK